MTNPEAHSIDTLNPKLWVPVNGILRYQGEHLEMPRSRQHMGAPGTCGCGRPAYSKRARYCMDCRLSMKRESEQLRRRKTVNHGPVEPVDGGALWDTEATTNGAPVALLGSPRTEAPNRSEGIG